MEIIYNKSCKTEPSVKLKKLIPQILQKSNDLESNGKYNILSNKYCNIQQ